MEMGNVPKRQQPNHRKKTTADGHQQVFNAAGNSRTFLFIYSFLIFFKLEMIFKINRIKMLFLNIYCRKN